ncbi:hypothetical protein [Endozoicomonas atrinae]|uniref:hypothetical protein n=1 Tax=Endozoicomonas atrinae TaxID=1333660 RepID=UPI001112E1F6|nr:hypothetical protein [Endozoicomonas atrinae]
MLGILVLLVLKMPLSFLGLIAAFIALRGSPIGTLGRAILLAGKKLKDTAQFIVPHRQSCAGMSGCFCMFVITQCSVLMMVVSVSGGIITLCSGLMEVVMILKQGSITLQ